MEFDKKTMKIMRYIYRHPGTREGKILKLYGDDGFSFTLINLTRELYLIAEDKDGKYFTYNDVPYVSYPETKYYTTPKMNVILENKRDQFYRWILPLIIAGIALLLSVVSLINTGIVDVRILNWP